MSDDLLPHYNRELAYLRRLGARFADAHPKIAGRLRLSAEGVEDPHVSRLIESVAFLNARIRRKLDDDFPELTDALLGVLYPHLLAPLPSMAVVQLEGGPDASAAIEVPAGTMLESDPVHGEPCRFRTGYPVSVLPLEVAAASLTGSPFRAPPSPHAATSAACLRVALRGRNDGATLRDLGADRLRFFLRGPGQVVHALYELIFNDVVDVVLATSPEDPQPLRLGPDCLRQVGFGRDEGLLPYSGRSHLGYRLLAEFFAFPAKFLFFDVAGLDPAAPASASRDPELYLYLRRSTSDLEQELSAENFALGCSPVVNLFSHRAEPLPLSEAESEVRVVLDARRPQALEVYSVDSVTASTGEGRVIPYQPFYGLRHDETEDAAYFHARRGPAPPTQGEPDSGSEVYLSLIDLEFETGDAADRVLDVETTCLNRNLPSRLPFGGDQPRLHFSEGGSGIKHVRCLTSPTPTRRPELGRGAAWRLISHLSLNHLSLGGGAEGTEALREILRLYEPTGGAENRAVIEGLLEVRARSTVLRTAGGVQPGFCQGLEVGVHLDEERFAGSGMFLFACVLERFIGLYVALNSSVQTFVTTTQREGELRRWAPRSGEQVLL